MQKIRWILTTVVGVALSLMWTFYVVSATEAQTEPPLDIEIIVAQTEVVLGAPMTWRIILTPCAQVSIDSLELRPGDARTWAWPDGFQAVGGLTNTVVLDVAAVPLVSGDLHPILEAHYIAGGEMQTQLVMGGTPVHVESVEKLVEAGVIARRGTVRKGDRLPVELWIVNDSPFKLTEVELHGSGTDTAWDELTSPLEILPHHTHMQVLYAKIDGERPRPQLNIRYVWTDAMGKSHKESLSVSGEVLTLSEFVIKEPWRTVLSVLGGVVTGSLIALIPAYFREKRERKRQKEANCSYVAGLLRLMVLQSQHAADTGVSADVGPLRTIFEKEGLFSVVGEAGLTENVRDLWRAAERHSSGLNQPGGAQRSERLRETARALGQKLGRIEEEQ